MKKKKIILLFLALIVLILIALLLLSLFGQKKDREKNEKSVQTTTKQESQEKAVKEVPSETLEQSRQSKLMLEYTGESWSPQLEEDLKQTDFEAYNFDVENPSLIQDVNSIFVLANKANYFPPDFEPINLITPQTNHAGGPDRRSMRRVAANALDTLTTEAKESGYDIQTVSAYRTIAYQEVLFNNYAASDGEEAANRYSSKPGHSEHHTGLCVDVSSPSVSFGLDQSYGTTPEGMWLEENAHRYGFVIRYPKGKEDLTGYTYEPWHIRYLGVPLATYLKENDLCYEEFLALQQNKTPDEIRIDY